MRQLEFSSVNRAVNEKRSGWILQANKSSFKDR